MNRGIVYGLGAYLAWGFLPIYWKAVKAVPPTQILAHRIVWSFIFLLGLILARRGWGQLRAAVKTPRTVVIFTLAACLLAVNWLMYIWGVNNNRIVETSLGYFINPLVNILLGVIFLRERLRRGQWLAVGVAGLGVLYLTLLFGALPWLALGLAFTFGIYALLKKTASMEAFNGLTLETGSLFIPFLGFLLVMETRGQGSFGHVGLTTTLLLALSGVVTALPLLLFGLAVRRVSLTTIGILQYISPTCQFFLGVLAYGEPFSGTRLVGFLMVWAALVIYTVEGLQQRSKA